MLRAARVPTVLRPLAARMMSTEVPINQVARVTRTHVGNEANALEADGILSGLLPG